MDLYVFYAAVLHSDDDPTYFALCADKEGACGFSTESAQEALADLSQQLSQAAQWDAQRGRAWPAPLDKVSSQLSHCTPAVHMACTD